MIPILGALVQGAISIGSRWFQNQAEKSQARHERDLEVIKGDQDWDAEQARNSGDSWKDEYLTILITVPFVAMFVAAVVGDMGVVYRIQEAFVIVQERVPEQYWTLLYVCFAASFGIKGIVKGLTIFRDGSKEEPTPPNK